jgi:hypothetical protein
LRLREIGGGGVTLETGDRLSSALLAERLEKGDAHALFVLAASAGPEVAEEAKRLWAEDRPDEAFFLDRFAAAVTEGSGPRPRSAEPPPPSARPSCLISPPGAASGTSRTSTS